MKHKIFDKFEDWYHPEIDFNEMIENFQWTRDILKETIGRKYSFPLNDVMLMHHAKAWEYDPKTGKEIPSRQQMFQFWNKQFNDALADVIKATNPKIVLDICSGDGTLAMILKRRGIPVIATDNYSWPFKKRNFKVYKMDYKKALAKINPDVVIGCWMPLNTNWTLDFRRTKSVKHYIQIGEVNMCCGGDWEDRKTWPIFRCDKASKYALCRTDAMWNYKRIFGKHYATDSVNDWMMHHSAAYITSRRKNALTIKDISCDN